MSCLCPAWVNLSEEAAGGSRMNCYPEVKREGLLQPKRVAHDLRQAAVQRRLRVKAPEKLDEILQGDFNR